MTLLVAKEICCDYCRFSVRLDAPTLAEEWLSLQSDGWTRGDNKHKCPVCSKTK